MQVTNRRISSASRESSSNNFSAASAVRSVEAEADAFGLNAAREPQGFAMAAMRLSTYRKLKPGPLEEFIFYDHPSGYDRVRRSMIWLKENQNATPSR